jgi:hypothetical protein
VRSEVFCFDVASSEIVIGGARDFDVSHAQLTCSWRGAERDVGGRRKMLLECEISGCGIAALIENGLMIAVAERCATVSGAR